MTVFDRDSVPEFSKDLKKLMIPRIDDDLLLFEKVFTSLKTRTTGLMQIPGLQKRGVFVSVYKTTKFRCKSLGKGARSGIRVVFAYLPEVDKVIYIEIYRHNQSKNRIDKQDDDRIIRHFKGEQKPSTE